MTDFCQKFKRCEWCFQEMTGIVDKVKASDDEPVRRVCQECKPMALYEPPERKDLTVKPL